LSFNTSLAEQIQEFKIVIIEFQFVNIFQSQIVFSVRFHVTYFVRDWLISLFEFKELQTFDCDHEKFVVFVV